MHGACNSRIAHRPLCPSRAPLRKSEVVFLHASILMTMNPHPALTDWPENGQSGCVRCSSAPPSDQLALFDLPLAASVRVGEVMDGCSALVARSHPDWPLVETSACGRPGFWRPRTPAVFGPRSGVGPLIAFPDTNVLISLHQEVEGAAGFTLHTLWSDRVNPVDALRDLVQLWWYRDVRFRVSPIHLIDAQRPMTPKQQAARRAACHELEQDFRERGGYEPYLRDVSVEDQPCALHSTRVRPAVGPPIPSTQSSLPKRGQDKNLVFEALDEGCHTFVTTDKKILRCHRYFMSLGLAILSPTQLLEELDSSGELDDSGSPLECPSPDISALARFYGAFESECFEVEK